MTYNPDFKVTIIQRQITWKWYNIELYLQWPTDMIYRTAPFSMTLNNPYPGFKITPFFDAEYFRNGTRYTVSMTRSVARSLYDSRVSCTIRRLKSAQKFAGRVCQMATAVMETTQLVLRWYQS